MTDDIGNLAAHDPRRITAVEDAVAEIFAEARATAAQLRADGDDDLADELDAETDQWQAWITRVRVRRSVGLGPDAWGPAHS